MLKDKLNLPLNWLTFIVIPVTEIALQSNDIHLITRDIKLYIAILPLHLASYYINYLKDVDNINNHIKTTRT